MPWSGAYYQVQQPMRGPNNSVTPAAVHSKGLGRGASGQRTSQYGSTSWDGHEQRAGGGRGGGQMSVRNSWQDGDGGQAPYGGGVHYRGVGAWRESETAAGARNRSTGNLPHWSDSNARSYNQRSDPGPGDVRRSHKEYSRGCGGGRGGATLQVGVEPMARTTQENHQQDTSPRTFGSAQSRRSGRESSRDRRDTSTHRRPLESPGPSSEPESLPVAPRPQDIADAATAREDKPLHQPASNSPHNASMDRRVQLLAAAIGGNTEEVKRCVEAGESLEALSSRPGQDQPPLHLACRHGRLETAKYLLCAGASTTATSQGLAAVHWASSGGHIEILKLLKESGCDLGLLADDGSTALHFALMEKQSETALLLVREGASLETLNKRHQTPLDVAEVFGSLEIKSFLKTTVKENQLHEAACDGDTTTLQQLISLDRVDVNARSHAKKYRGWQAVHRAAEEGRVQVVNILLESGAVADARTSKEGPMAVHLAAQGGHSKIVKLLLKVMDDRTREALVEGRTLIHLAAIGGHLDVLDCLYQHGFDLNAATVTSQQTPLHLACEYENEAAARWLLAAGADFRRSDHRGFLAKDVAVEAGSTRLAAYLKKTETTWNKITTPTKNYNPQGETERPGRKGGRKGANWNPGLEGPKKILPKGLQSVGNTCYLNAVLQCLYHTTDLTNFLLGEDWRSHKSGPSSEYGGVIVERYRQVMAALLTSEEARRRTLPAVLHLKETVSQFERQFLGQSQQEAHDMLAFLLDALDKDLQREEPSYPAQLFLGLHVSTITCRITGKDITKVEEPFTNLSLPVTKRPWGRDAHTLKECLQKYYEDQSLVWDCPFCRTSHLCIRNIYIKRLPKILVIHLSRLMDSPTDRHKEKVVVPLTLTEVKDYSRRHRHSHHTYDLYGVCHHQGTSTWGHYTASCRGMEEGAWHSFSDEVVTECRGNTPSLDGAHLLFYETRGGILEHY